MRVLRLRRPRSGAGKTVPAEGGGEADHHLTPIGERTATPTPPFHPARGVKVAPPRVMRTGWSCRPSSPAVTQPPYPGGGDPLGIWPLGIWPLGIWPLGIWPLGR